MNLTQISMKKTLKKTSVSAAETAESRSGLMHLSGCKFFCRSFFGVVLLLVLFANHVVAGPFFKVGASFGGGFCVFCGPGFEKTATVPVSDSSSRE